MTKKHVPAIDALYTIGVVLVVLGHSHSSDWSSFRGTFLNALLATIYTFHMPLFFFIAGFLFSHSDSLEKNGYGKWLGKKAVRLLTPYLVLSALALLPKYYLEHHGFEGFSFPYLLRVLLVPRIGVWGHFWFLPVLLEVYAVFGLWKKLSPVADKRLWTGLVVPAALILYFLPCDTPWLGFSDFKQQLIFFSIGALFSELMKSGKIDTNSAPYHVLSLIGGGLALFAVFEKHGNRTAELCAAVLMIFLCWQAAQLIGERALCRWVSRHCFTIYLYSWPFQAVMMILAERCGLPWYGTSICMFLTGIIAPLVLILLYEKLLKRPHRFFDLVLGVKRETV